MHHVLFGGVLFMVLGGLYFWFPKMTGRMLNETAGKITFWSLIVGFNLTFLPQYSAGMSGMARRVVEYSSDSGVTGYNVASTIGSFVIALGIAVTVANVFWSLRKGAIAGGDPWRANSLEWFTTSPPPAHNFDVIPTVRSLEPMKDYRRRALNGDVDGSLEKGELPPSAAEPAAR
jgi:cytochrome c oxidase subunit 1